MDEPELLKELLVLLILHLYSVTVKATIKPWIDLGRDECSCRIN